MFCFLDPPSSFLPSLVSVDVLVDIFLCIGYFQIETTGTRWPGGSFIYHWVGVGC